LKTGDQILFIKDDGNDYIFRLVTGSIMDLKGCVRWTGEPVTIEEMNETILKGWAGELTFEDQALALTPAAPRSPPAHLRAG
jgi:hypothetical protein